MQRTSRPPSLPPVSLTFVPSPSGIGGVLVPTAAKPHRKSNSHSVPKSDHDSLSEEAGSLDSDSNTSSPVSVLPPSSFSTDNYKPLELSAVPPLQSSCAIQKNDVPQALSSYSPMNSRQIPSAPKLPQTDSCISESFLLNTSPFSDNASGPALCLGTPAWSPNTAVQQFQAGSPSTQFDSPASGQVHQPQQYMPSPPPQLASLQQLQPQYQSLGHFSPLQGGLSHPVPSGMSSNTCPSTGVPSLAVGHPVTPAPPHQSLRDSLSQHPLPQQPTAPSAPDFEVDFDMLCDPMSNAASTLSMTSLEPSASLHELSRTDHTSIPQMGSHQRAQLLGSPQAGPGGLPQDDLAGPPQVGLGTASQPALRDSNQVSSLLPSYRDYLRGSDSDLERQTAPQSSFTFVPARCSSPPLCCSPAASSLSQSMQSQVVVHLAQMQTVDFCIALCSSFLHCSTVVSCWTDDLCQVCVCVCVCGHGPALFCFSGPCGAQPLS